MAVIVEIKPEESAPTPKGPDGRFTAEQKGKDVPREQSQRDFLRRFVSHTPEPEPSRYGMNNKTYREPRKADKGAEREKHTHQESRERTTPFQREPSQIPDGGWFRATVDTAGGGGRGPPSSYDSSSSDDESSSSDSSSSNSSIADSSEGHQSHSTKSRKTRSERKHRSQHKKDKRRMRKALSGVKIKTPFVWDGTADLDLFDQWTYEVDTWAELNELPDRVVIKLMIQFMKGEAGKFFMRHVSTRQSEWTVKKLYEALFDYCFPSDYKARLRARLERSYQGKNRVRDFVRDIQQLAVRFPDVTDFQLVQIFWKGLNTHLRVYLIEKGLNPEKTKLDKLVKYAVRKEDAYTEARREEHSFTGKVPGRKWGRFDTRVEGPEAYQPDKNQREGAFAKNKQRTDRSGQSDTKRAHTNAPKRPRREGERSNTLSREERDQLRAEGRCFNCREAGHQSSNCPARKTAKAPPGVGLQAGAVNFETLEKLAERARRTHGDTLFSGAVTFGTGTEPLESCQEGDWTRVHELDCIEYVQSLFTSYYDPQTAIEAGLEPSERFDVERHGGEDFFLITDRLAFIGLPEEYVVSRKQLDDPNWGVSEILQQEWNDWIEMPTPPVWGTGFPQCDGLDRDHCPLYWLRAHVAATLRVDYPSLPNRDGLIRIETCPEGYVATTVLHKDEHVFTYQELCDRSFDPTAVSRVLLDGYTSDEIWQWFRTQERRRHRRMRLMVGAATMRKPQGRKSKPVEVPSNAVPAIERNAMRPKDSTRKAPMPIVVSVTVNGHRARALLDTGCMADFISTTLVDQLKIPTVVL
ncbi:hypothetical protein GY45DRAFT_1211891, partial [Cubamyces sp. BRFM 1775]